MSKSYLQISYQLARQISLVMTDVDGTIAAGGEPASPAVADAVRRLERQDIKVGLVSGRTLPDLERMARDLGMTGPIIAENGAVAKIKAGEDTVDLGYSRQPALDALAKLQKLFPGIKGRSDNADRIIDVVFFSDNVKPSELKKHVGDIQVLDSGYIFHLMQPGISKGNTLNRILGPLPDNGVASGNLMIFGDSLTDISLFELFPNGILVPNPLLGKHHREELEHVAAYISDSPSEEGFIEVTSHILNLRSNHISFT